MTQRLGDILVSERLLTFSQLEEAIETQCLYGGRLGTSIVELGFLSEEEIARTLSRKLRLPYIEPKLLMKIPSEVIDLVPQKLAKKHLVIPCRLEKKRLYLAMSDPTNLTVIDSLAFRLGFIIVPVVVPEIRLMLALQKYYQLDLSIRFQSLSQRLVANKHKKRESKKAAQPNPDSLTDVADEDILDLDNESVNKWPLLGEEESFDILSDEEYQDLINLPKHLRIKTETHPPKIGADPQVTLEVHKLERKEQQPFALFCKQLSSAENRDDIAQAIIDYIAPVNGVAALLMVKEREALGWIASSAGEPLQNFETLQISLEQPSILNKVAETKVCYLGSLAKEVGNIQLSSRFGHEHPPMVLLMPLILGGRLVSLLYLQDTRERLQQIFSEHHKLANKICMAFEVLILKNKIMIG